MCGPRWSRIGGWVEDIIPLYAARALGGLCINSAQICEMGKTGNKEPRYERQKGRALAIYVLTKGDGKGWAAGCGDLMHVDWIDRIIFVRCLRLRLCCVRLMRFFCGCCDLSILSLYFFFDFDLLLRGWKRGFVVAVMPMCGLDVAFVLSLEARDSVGDLFA